MHKSFFLASACVLLAQPLFAAEQTVDQRAAQNALNWDIFLKLYPKRALAAREEGAVGFNVTLDSKGEVTRCQVTHTSGHPLLDEETCQIVTMNAQFNPDPSLSPSQTRTHEGLIAWKLPAGATVLEPPKPVAVAKAPEQVMCKRTVRVGTLAGFERTCMTPTEWARRTEQEREAWDDIRAKGHSFCGEAGGTAGAAPENGMSGAPPNAC
jgi:TonB family protein